MFEKTCVNCKYIHHNSFVDPCRSCTLEDRDNWEPNDDFVVTTATITRGINDFGGWATSCLVCDETIPIDNPWDSPHRICPKCKKAIMRARLELEAYERLMQIMTVGLTDEDT